MVMWTARWEATTKPYYILELKKSIFNGILDTRMADAAQAHQRPLARRCEPQPAPSRLLWLHLTPANELTAPSPPP